MTALTVDAPLDLAGVWRRLRLPLLLAAIFVGVAVLLAVFADNPAQRPMDPRDASPHGALALRRLVGEQGTTVSLLADATTIDATGTTVLIPDPGSVAATDLGRLASTADVVVVLDPGERELRALQIVARTTSGLTGTVDPRCTFAPAAQAGDIDYDGSLYEDASDIGCYPAGAGSALVVHRMTQGSIIVFGSTTAFTNAKLDHHGNAALALSLLTQRPRLMWLLPRPPAQRAPDASSKGLLDLLPARLLWATAQLAICVVVIALWRARRLGPVVVEPLPVVVRAVETVEGRARLMRAARARADAGQTLREATRARLGELLTLGGDIPPPAMVDAVARRSGRAPEAVHDVLYGAAPTDDKALVVLANDLADLEDAVRRT